MMSDPIADMLTIIRNGYMVHKKTVVVSFSKQKLAITEVLKKENYLKAVEQCQKSDGPKKELVLNLNYLNKKSSLEKIVRVSKPSRRVYVDKNNLPYVLSGYGIAIISTSKGFMTASQARKMGLGGEIICKLW